jgi:hypothetical protein
MSFNNFYEFIQWKCSRVLVYFWNTQINTTELQTAFKDRYLLTNSRTRNTGKPKILKRVFLSSHFTN